MLIDYVIADRADAERLAAAINPSKEWPAIEGTGIEHVKLGRLMSVLSESEYDPGFIAECEQLAEASEDGPFVFLVPPRLVTTLARLTPNEVRTVATEWSHSEEFSLDGWTKDEVIETLERLFTLAKQAAHEGKHLLMWVSL